MRPTSGTVIKTEAYKSTFSWYQKRLHRCAEEEFLYVGRFCLLSISNLSTQSNMEDEWNRSDILALLQLVTMIVLPPLTALFLLTYQVVLSRLHDP